MKVKNSLFSVLLCFILLLSSCSKSKNESGSSKFTDNLNANIVKKMELSFLTADDINIKGDYYYSNNSKDLKEPLIILIHQFRSNREQWNKTLIDSLINNGYKVLAYDIRNHGESGKSDVRIEDILTKTELAPKDLEAVIKWAKNQNSVDSTKIGLVGTSIDASLALYARYFLNAKSIIGISGGRSTFEGLTGINDRSMSMIARQRINSVFFICGSKDNDCLKDEEYIMNNYIMKPMQLKVYDSDKHGKDLIQQYPDINNLILEWFRNNL